MKKINIDLISNLKRNKRFKEVEDRINGQNVEK